MQTKIGYSTESFRLISARFERHTPDMMFEIEATYRLYWPEDFTLKGEPFVLYFLSATRTDTREAVTLTQAEVTDVMEACVVRASEECSEA